MVPLNGVMRLRFAVMLEVELIVPLIFRSTDISPIRVQFAAMVLDSFRFSGIADPIAEIEAIKADSDFATVRFAETVELELMAACNNRSSFDRLAEIELVPATVELNLRTNGIEPATVAAPAMVADSGFVATSEPETPLVAVMVAESGLEASRIACNAL